MADHSSHLNIGLLINQMDINSNYPIWNALADLAEEQNFNLTLIVGRSLKSPSLDDRMQNAMYNLVSGEQFDGFIVCSGMIGNYVGIEEFMRFLEPHRSKKIISLSMQLPGIPSVLTDNSQGMYSAINHLIQVHQKSKIAFIRGPATNPEAVSRYEAYLKALKANNIPFDASLVIQGDFRSTSGRNGVLELLDNRKAHFDALVAANDDMAYSAFLCLRERGYSVPEEISLCGFDDIDDIRVISPAFTTVRQPFYEIARTAGLLLLKALKGEEIPLTTVLNAKLLIRQSCGCSGRTFDLDRLRTFPKIIISEVNDSQINLQEISQARQTIVTNLLAILDIDPIDRDLFQDFSEHFLENLCIDLTLKNSQSKMLTYLIEKFKMPAEKVMIQTWPMLITALEQVVIREISESGLQRKASLLLQEALLFIYDIQAKTEAARNLKFRQIQLSLNQLMQRVNNTFDRPAIMKILLEWLPLIGLKNTFIALYDEPCFINETDEGRFPHTAKLVLAFDETGDRLHAAGNLCFLTKALLPDGIFSDNRRRSLAINALYLQNRHFGYVITDIGIREGAIYTTLRELISSALQTTELFMELDQALDEVRSRNAHIEAEIELARKIQLQFLPSVSPLPELAFFFKPTESVSGDFFDIIQFREATKIGLFMSDVSGHGVPAAFITSMLKSLLLQSGGAKASPSELLFYLNDLLFNQTGGNFITAFYGIYDCADNSFTYANAGHNPPYLVNDDGLIEIDSTKTSYPIGIMSSADILSHKKGYHNSSLNLSPYRKLIIYTDGLIEASSKDDINSAFGDNSLNKSILSHLELPSRYFVKELYKDLSTFRQSDSFEDDICIICLDIKRL